MNQFRKLQKAFITWKNSLSASSDKEKKHDDYTDAMAYLKERQREAEYNEALRRINPPITHPLMNQSAANAATAGMWSTTTGALSGNHQAWPSNPGVLTSNTSYPYEQTQRPIRQFAVEKADNGFIIRSGKYSKVCKDMDDLADQFVAIMVEAQLDK